MKETFETYDSADYLHTQEDMLAYLEAAIQASDSAQNIAHALGVVARARNTSQLAREAGISREGLYKALSENGNPRLETVVQVARALGLKIVFAPCQHADACVSAPRMRNKTAPLAA